ncbi:MAG: AAA family ATPase [Eubacteriales bacterium]|nr:AAA family ATPase [Eubacteriales bacterium]
MGKMIAFAGKGGVGKTTLCGLAIQHLCREGRTPVLAVDADANSNLNEVLGVESPETLGQIREEVERAADMAVSPIPKGMTKADYMEMRLEDALTETKDFDLMVMGRSQGKGCYCYVNGLVQTQLRRLQNGYPYIVVDNEAGLEHISRGLLPSIDTAVLVSDCSRRGVQAASRIAQLMDEMDMRPGRIGIIINKAPDGKIDPGTMAAVNESGLELLGAVPADEDVYRFDCDGRPTAELPEDSPVREAFGRILEKLDL